MKTEEKPSRFAGLLRGCFLESSDWEFRRWVLVVKSYAYLQDSERSFEMVLSFVQSILLLRAKWDFSVTSWGRTFQHNKEVGGHPESFHRLWLGLDVVLDVMEKNLSFEGDAHHVGLVAIFEKDHYHLQPVGL